jgi:hypothetical protein
MLQENELAQPLMQYMLRWRLFVKNHQATLLRRQAAYQDLFIRFLVSTQDSAQRDSALHFVRHGIERVSPE